MKARFPSAAVVATASVLTLSACNQDETQAEPKSTSQSLQPAPPPAEAPPTSQTPAGPQTSPMMEQMRASCPMVVEGARVEVSDTEKGVALSFSTKDGDVAALRQRVEHMGQMYGSYPGHGHVMWHHMGGMHGSGMGGPGMHGQPGMGGPGMGPGAGHGPMPAVMAKVSETEQGARLELTPSDASQLATLREHMRLHQQRMQSGQCWMLQDQAPAESAK